MRRESDGRNLPVVYDLIEEPGATRAGGCV